MSAGARGLVAPARPQSATAPSHGAPRLVGREVIAPEREGERERAAGRRGRRARRRDRPAEETCEVVGEGEADARPERPVRACPSPGKSARRRAARSSGAMPGPVSVTVTRASPARASTLTRTAPPSGVNLSAFESTLARIVPTCAGSVQTSTAASGVPTERAMRRCVASGCEGVRLRPDERGEVEPARAQRRAAASRRARSRIWLMRSSTRPAERRARARAPVASSGTRPVLAGEDVVERAERERERGPELVARRWRKRRSGSRWRGARHRRRPRLPRGRR